MGNIFQISGNFSSFDHQLSHGEKTNFLFDNGAASNSYVKQALIRQSQTFVALQGLWLRHNTKSSLGWEAVSKINKAVKRRNYKHSAVKNEGKPSKQSVACSILNSFTAWHKDACQTTEEMNGGMTEKWKKKKHKRRSTEVRTWGIFHSQRSEIYMQPCTNNYVVYCILRECL